MTALDKAGLVGLAERVEALAGPCRETDALIWEIVAPDEWAVFVAQNRAMMPKARLEADKLATLAARAKASAPRFTASLDAAMTLVPEGLRLQIGEWDDEKHLRPRGPWQAILTKPGCSSGFGDMLGFRCEHAATPALALTAAALRAIAAHLAAQIERNDDAG